MEERIRDSKAERISAATSGAPKPRSTRSRRLSTAGWISSNGRSDALKDALARLVTSPWPTACSGAADLRCDAQRSGPQIRQV